MRNCSKQAISPFPTVFSTPLENFQPFSSNLKLLTANSSSLEESEICHLGKGSNLIYFDKRLIYEGLFLSSWSRAVFLKPLEISKFYLLKTFEICPVCLHTHFTPIYPFPEPRPVVLFRYMLQTLVDRTAYTTTGFKTVPCQHFL